MPRDYFPGWIRRARVAKENGEVEHAVAEDAATLVYLANQACVTLHVGLARVDRIHHPDRLVIDFDPSDEDFDKVKRAARAARRLLEETGLVPFVQTTGSRGLHVWVPLEPETTFDEVRGFAADLADRLVAQAPEELTTEQRKAKRGTRVFVDVARNAYGQTAVAPYSVRARAEAPVATPWTGPSSTTPASARRATRSPICFAASARSPIPGPGSAAMRGRSRRCRPSRNSRRS